jgi:hypothetical protein
MSLTEYKESIKKIIDSINDEKLLQLWKSQLEHDIEHRNEIELTEDELQLVREGLEDYNKKETISFEEFISKRR